MDSGSSCQITVTQSPFDYLNVVGVKCETAASQWAATVPPLPHKHLTLAYLEHSQMLPTHKFLFPLHSCFHYNNWRLFSIHELKHTKRTEYWCWYWFIVYLYSLLIICIFLHPYLHIVVHCHPLDGTSADISMPVPPMPGKPAKCSSLSLAHLYGYLIYNRESNSMREGLPRAVGRSSSSTSSFNTGIMQNRFTTSVQVEMEGKYWM